MGKLFFLWMATLIVSNSLFAQISMQQDKAGYWVLDGKRKIGFYQAENTGVDREVGRSNYWHPLYLPDGTVITEDSPADHLLHRGIFLAWHQVIIGDRLIGDSWICKDIDLKIQEVKFEKNEDTKGIIKTLTFWHSPQWENGKFFVEEANQYTFYTQKSNYNVIKIEISLKALTDGVYIGGSDDSKGYGGFSVRMKMPKDIQFVSSGGQVTPMNDAVDAGYYMNIFGTLTDDNKQGGVMIYADPKNQSGPQTWILRSSGSMQNPVYPGRTPVLIPKDKPTKLTYYLVLYTGKINPEEIIQTYCK